jgi:hypothetical protein
MRLKKLFLITVLAGAMSVLGCGDDGGNGNGNGGASSVCNACEVSSLAGECESTYNVCIQDDVGSQEDCAAAGLLRCSGEV